MARQTGLLLGLLLWVALLTCRAAETATAVATVSAGSVTGITITSGGSGYTREPSVTFSGGGGSGATATAVLQGDRVSLIVVQTGGAGYSTAPAVIIEPPRQSLDLRLDLVPKLTVTGPPGGLAIVEWAVAVGGPWTVWKTVVVESTGTSLVDVEPAALRRFYRVSTTAALTGPTGLVWIAPATFEMGSPLIELDRGLDEIRHSVTLTQGFWISDHEVTQAEYEAVMGSNPSGFQGADRPVEQVSWHDAVEYCRRLTERERSAGRITAGQEYRLPTEAEWEFAARAGTTGERHGELDAIGWHGLNSGLETHPVKSKQPNAWGLHDMIGNVWEWCSDWYGEFSMAAVVDPVGPENGTRRVSRGGGWSSVSVFSRSARRLRDVPVFQSNILGFRIVRVELR